MNDPSENPNDAWEACRPGELQHLVRGAMLHHRVRAVRRTVLTGGAATVVAVAAWMTVSHFWLVKHRPCIAGEYCEDVRLAMPDLIAMRLEPQRAARLRQHLAQCPDCRSLMQQMGGEIPLSFDRHHHYQGDCAHCDCAAKLAAAGNWPAYGPGPTGTLVGWVGEGSTVMMIGDLRMLFFATP